MRCLLFESLPLARGGCLPGGVCFREFGFLGVCFVGVDYIVMLYSIVSGQECIVNYALNVTFVR
jgi:hypothetical protein